MERSRATDDPLSSRDKEPRLSSRRRWAVGVLLMVFFLVTVVTSIFSLGAYCLTSDGGDTRALHGSVRFRQKVPLSKVASPPAGTAHDRQSTGGDEYRNR